MQLFVVAHLYIQQSKVYIQQINVKLAVHRSVFHLVVHHSVSTSIVFYLLLLCLLSHFLLHCVVLAKHVRGPPQGGKEPTTQHHHVLFLQHHPEFFFLFLIHPCTGGCWFVSHNLLAHNPHIQLLLQCTRAHIRFFMGLLLLHTDCLLHAHPVTHGCSFTRTAHAGKSNTYAV